MLKLRLTATALRKSFAHARWLALMSRTKSVPSLMARREGQTSAFSRTRWRKPLPLQSWTVSNVCTGFAPGARPSTLHHRQAGGSQNSRLSGTGDASAGSGRPWQFPGPTEEWVLFKADVTKAHRRIKVPLCEWRYQVAQLGDEWWVNTVGTYGMASAQLYWGRMAAILLRIAYAVFPEVDWCFVFVDDFAWLLRESSSSLLATSLCLLLLALGTPP